MAKLATDLELDSALTLSQAAIGCDFQIRQVEGTNGRNMLCTVCGTRLALSKDLADQIQVVPA